MTSKQTIVEQPYEPVNYFDAPSQQNYADYTIRINSGNVEVELNQPNDPMDHVLLSEILQKIRWLFKVQQISTSRTFELQTDRVHQFYEDGSEKKFVYASTKIEARSSVSCFPTITHSDGTITDTKADYLARNESLQTLIHKFAISDPIVRRIVESYSTAIDDSANALVHLYEIRDALAKGLGGDHKAKKTLAFSSSKWKRFGELCNVLPLREGRHRGQNLGSLRDATPAELEESRKIAREMIGAYVNYVS